MADYVVGGMQLAPVDPTITEQRDAVLAAAAANDKDDFVAMAKAFAVRGAGTCAVSPDRNSNNLNDVMEDFNVAPNATIVSVALDDKGKSCDKDGYVDVGEGGRVVVVVTNNGAAALTGAKVKVSTTSADVKFPSGATVDLPDLQPFDTINAVVDVSLADTVKGPLAFDVTAELDADQACNKSASTTIAAHANVDEKPMSSTTDDVEAGKSTWKAKGDGSDLIWSIVTSGAGNHAWSGIDFSSPSDTNLESPTLEVGSAKNFVMSFDHKFNFEQSMGTNWDGSVIEISIDAGATWQDISMYGDPGYGGSIGAPMANNPLIGRTGYVGKNMSDPKFDHVSIDMGKALAGKSVKVRFRIGTDDAQGEPGWTIDNVAFDGITNTPFASLVADDTTCTMGTGGGGGGSAVGGGGPAATGAGGGAGGGQGTGGMGPESSGCGCELPGHANDSTAPSLALIAALGAIASRRRRRRA
jgi:MYXO-CTERM domain-containing protein